MSTETKKELDKGTGFLNLSTLKTEDNQPDFFGTANIDGVIHKLAGWKRISESSKQAFLSISLDLEFWTEEEAKETHEKALKEYEERKKDTEDYILADFSGSLHRAKAEKNEDYFGTLRTEINGEMKDVYIKGFATKSKKGASIIRLAVSDGVRTKEERNEIADTLF